MGCASAVSTMRFGFNTFVPAAIPRCNPTSLVTGTLLSIANDDSRDAQVLRRAALQVMAQDYRTGLVKA